MRPVRFFVAAVGLLALAGCGTSPTAGEGFKAAGNVVKTTLSRTKASAPAGLTPAQINAGLAQTTGPAVLAVFALDNTQAFLTEVGRNGRHISYGNAARQVVVLRDGFLTNTRGLGFDVMSSDSRALERLIRQQKAGTARYGLTLLDGDDQPVTHDFTCTVTRKGTAPVALGAVNTTARLMVADCQSETQKVQKAFLVARDGYILSTKQWLGPENGFLTVQVLRR